MSSRESSTAKEQTKRTAGENMVGEEARTGNLGRQTGAALILYFPTIVIQGLVGLCTASLLSKFFAPAEYGHFVLAHGVYLGLSMVTGLWIERAIARFIPEFRTGSRYPELLRTVLVSQALVVLCFTALCLFLLFVFKHTMAPQLYSLMIVAVIGSAFLSLFTPISSAYWVSGRSTVYVGLTLLRVLGGLGSGLFLALHLNLGMKGFFIGLNIPIAATVVWVGASKFFRIVTILRQYRFSVAVLRDLVSYSAPLVCMQLTALVLGMADRYFIQAYAGSSEVAVYSIGHMIAYQWMQIVLVVLTTASDPVMFRSWEEQGQHVTVDYLNRMLRYYTLCAVPFLAALLLLGKELVSLVSTRDYFPAVPIMGYVGLAAFMHGYTQMLNRTYALRKRTGEPFINFLAASIVNVGLNSMLVPVFGFVSAAWSLVISYAVLLVITYIRSRRLLSLEIGRVYLLKSLLASAGMAVVLWFCRHVSLPLVPRLMVCAIAGFISYSTLIICLRGVTPSETRLFSGWLKRYLPRIKGAFA
jgi:O-antigen/teichoic acid export membrane protein